MYIHTQKSNHFKRVPAQLTTTATSSHSFLVIGKSLLQLESEG